MSIGSTIKKLRRERDITQEQLADYLGISSCAVSQWECDRTAPDISQLPLLANIFEVSADVLLGIDTERKNEKIKQILETAEKMNNQAQWDKESDYLREQLKQYPNSYSIMEILAGAIVGDYSRKGIHDYDEVFDLCNRIIAECTDSITRYKAIRTLAIAYNCAGKKEKMLKVAEEMPEAQFSYENFMLYNWESDADFKKKQSYIFYLIDQMITGISCACGHRHDDDKMIYSTEERIVLQKLKVDLLEALFPDKDYQSLAQDGEIACSQIAIMLIRNNDLEKAWKWIEKSADFAIHMDTYDFKAPHTSLILRGYSDGGWIMEANGNRSQSMLEWLTTDDEAAALRSDSRYEALLERLKTVARKP